MDTFNTCANQSKTPLFDALKKYVNSGVIPFHVPGHKKGAGIKEFEKYVGKNVLQIDVNGMEDLDNICNPIGVIKEAENLLAALFDADDSFFLVNGTSQGVQAMIFYSCAPQEKIIIPRNAHKSTIGALILSGAIPVYIQPEINNELGIAMGVGVDKMEKAISEHADAKAVFMIHPTYYGAVSDLRTISDIAHSHDMLVLADEAHGCHLKFNFELPDSAMESGADISAVSIHKTGGSMTQSSALLIKNKHVDPLLMKTTLNLTQTTSASYVLMASLDMARKQLAVNGHKMIKEVLDLARYARTKINEIDGFYAFGPEMVGTPGVYKYDETKLCINVRRLGLSGYDMESILRKEYNIQIEMADFYNILAIISLGDNRTDIDKLISALKDISLKRGIHNIKNTIITPPELKLVIPPRDAYYANKKTVLLENSVGGICGEMIMAYPPGIPAICPGELISKEVVDYIKMLKESEYQLQGTKDPLADYIEILCS